MKNNNDLAKMNQ